ARVPAIPVLRLRPERDARRRRDRARPDRYAGRPDPHRTFRLGLKQRRSSRAPRLHDPDRAGDDGAPGARLPGLRRHPELTRSPGARPYRRLSWMSTAGRSASLLLGREAGLGHADRTAVPQGTSTAAATPTAYTSSYFSL